MSLQTLLKIASPLDNPIRDSDIQKPICADCLTHCLPLSVTQVLNRYFLKPFLCIVFLQQLIKLIVLLFLLCFQHLNRISRWKRLINHNFLLNDIKCCYTYLRYILDESQIDFVHDRETRWKLNFLLRNFFTSPCHVSCRNHAINIFRCLFGSWHGLEVGIFILHCS